MISSHAKHMASNVVALIHSASQTHSVPLGAARRSQCKMKNNPQHQNMLLEKLMLVAAKNIGDNKKEPVSGCMSTAGNPKKNPASSWTCCFAKWLLTFLFLPGVGIINHLTNNNCEAKMSKQLTCLFKLGKNGVMSATDGWV